MPAASHEKLLLLASRFIFSDFAEILSFLVHEIRSTANLCILQDVPEKYYNFFCACIIYTTLRASKNGGPK
jgi:hypothetical protein